MEIKRDRKIDIMRFLALVGIFIAHVGGPKWLMQLRSFDVPLMALLMGMSFYLSNKNREISYGKYFIKRIKRLVFPTWQFLTIFFILLFFIALLLGRPYFFDFSTIISSYLLLTGIGYVWIVGVFLGVALLNPMILKISNKIQKNSVYFLILLVIYLFYLTIASLQNFMSSEFALIYEHLVLYTIAYGIIAAIGIRFKKLNKKELFFGALVFLLFYIGLGIVNNFELTSIAKFPPTTYYFSYALGIIFALYLILDIPIIFNVLNNKFIHYVSENSLWIYFWHIIPVYSLSIITDIIPIIGENFILRFIFVVIVTTVLVIIQNLIKNAFGKYEKNAI